MSRVSHRSSRGVACVDWLDELVDTAGEPTSRWPCRRRLPRRRRHPAAGATGGGTALPRLWSRAMRWQRLTNLGLGLTTAVALSVPAPGQGRSVLRVAFPSEDGSLTPYTFTN